MSTFFRSTVATVARELFDSYDTAKLQEITSCRFTQAELMRWLQPSERSGLFTRTPLGTSGEGRVISLYEYGAGPITVMLWSQMHGDEPTATMALADMFSFFSRNPGHAVAGSIREKLKLLIIPMLNPDGAERFTRRNAQLIDLNRDAMALQTSEANILKTTRDRCRPDYGFNLHDQDPRYTAGASRNITAIALLAPAVDESRKDNPVRTRAKQIASTFAQAMNLFVPDHLAKWDDTFMPTAFGDSVQKWGTSTLLVESGGWRSDPEKFFIRKLNYVGLLTTLYAIAQGESENADISVYERIPFNMKLGCDYIIRNAEFRRSEQTPPLRVDLGLNFEKRIDPATRQTKDFASIAEIGDLSMFAALENELDARGAALDEGRIVLDRAFPAAEVAMLLKQK